MKRKEERCAVFPRGISLKPKSDGPIKPAKSPEFFAKLSQEVTTRHEIHAKKQSKK